MYINTCTGTCTCLEVSALGLETFFLKFATKNSDEKIGLLLLKSKSYRSDTF
jgi:hypothetical protein